MRKKILTAAVLLIAISLLFSGAFVQAESDVVEEVLEDYLEEEESEEDQPEDEEEEPEEELDEEDEEEHLVSAVFYEESIREALNELSLQTGVNIVYDETVVGTVTLDVEDVPLEEALEMLLISGGYTYRQIEEDYYIVGLPDPESPMYDDLTVTETIHLDYISASTAVELLPPFYDDFVSTSADQDDVLTISAPEHVIEDFKEDLAEIDYAPEEIRIDVVVTEITTEAMEEYGAEMLGLTSGDFEDAPFDLDPDEEEYALEYDGGGLFTVGGAGPDGEFMAELKALEEEDKADIQANPTVRVSEDEAAELFLGEERVIILEMEDDDDVLEEVEVGVALDIVPQITAEDEVRLQVAPEVSYFIEDREEGVGDELVVRRSEVESVVQAADGETITMAGMTLDEVMDYESMVPVLGDIPLTRWLFRRETQEKAEREMLMMITPEIVRE